MWIDEIFLEENNSYLLIQIELKSIIIKTKGLNNSFDYDITKINTFLKQTVSISLQNGIKWSHYLTENNLDSQIENFLC